ncbi:hypothetical protein BRD15_03220 [Halobacteriales archaeon SW_6_65_15]|nr:MAG: hypothetical protein BRD15_03220 [Halobacteriales archaeon SW_6_65_15]
MPDECSTLGLCPACETPVPAARLLIKYEKSGVTAVFADCPTCDEVVHPLFGVDRVPANELSFLPSFVIPT